MIRYKNLGQNSNVSTFEIGESSISVVFNNSPFMYIYDYSKPGIKHVETMKKLALEGKGLNAYINHYIKKNYAKRTLVK